MPERGSNLGDAQGEQTINLASIQGNHLRANHGFFEAEPSHYGPATLSTPGLSKPLPNQHVMAPHHHLSAGWGLNIEHPPSSLHAWTWTLQRQLSSKTRRPGSASLISTVPTPYTYLLPCFQVQCILLAALLCWLLDTGAATRGNDTNQSSCRPLPLPITSTRLALAGSGLRPGLIPLQHEPYYK